MHSLNFFSKPLIPNIHLVMNIHKAKVFGGPKQPVLLLAQRIGATRAMPQHPVHEAIDVAQPQPLPSALARSSPSNPAL